MTNKAMHLPEIFGLLTFPVFQTFWTFDAQKYFKNYMDFWQKNFVETETESTKTFELLTECMALMTMHSPENRKTANIVEKTQL